MTDQTPDTTTPDLTPFGNKIGPFEAALRPSAIAYAADLAAIDATLTGHAGTASARNAAILADMTTTEEATLAEVVATLTVGKVDFTLDDLDYGATPVLALRRATANLEAAKTAYDDAKQDVREAVQAALRLEKSNPEIAALVAKRDALVVSYKAALVLLEGEGNFTVPNAPKVSGSSSSGSAGTGSKVKSSKGVYAYRKAGKADFTVPCDAQQSVSATASRVFHVPVDDVYAALTAQGVDGKSSTPWEATITLNKITATLRFTVIGEDTADDTTEEDTSDDTAS